MSLTTVFACLRHHKYSSSAQIINNGRPRHTRTKGGARSSCSSNGCDGSTVPQRGVAAPSCHRGDTQ
ncbi:hypothetical protein BJV78DRAFT_371943 [Lactifluus subvellereus]|nr:hypothetical protein BJV78DRAFT_371943 [Lactifluus subvellereus]